MRPVTTQKIAVPAPGWLEALVAAAEAAPRVGMCASRMRLAAQPDRLEDYHAAQRKCLAVENELWILQLQDQHARPPQGGSGTSPLGILP